MEDKPTPVKNPDNVSYQFVTGLACCELDALMLGLRVEKTDLITGKTTVYNPEGKAAKLKHNDSALVEPTEMQAEAFLEHVISVLIDNDGSFSVETIWDYVRMIPDNPLTYKFIVTQGAARLEEIRKSGAVYCINDIETFKVYAKPSSNRN